jgi:hypothetical protein
MDLYRSKQSFGVAPLAPPLNVDLLTPQPDERGLRVLS